MTNRRFKPVTNPVVPVPSNQPSGAQVAGPRGAVQPNTGLAVPASPAPTVNNTRQDEKPETKTMSEGVAARKKVDKASAAAVRKKKLEAKKKAEAKQGKEAKDAVAPLGKREDDPPAPKTIAMKKTPQSRKS